jgi:hypothetical protein
MTRLLILIFTALLFVIPASQRAFADSAFKCDSGAGAKCHCSGSDSCKSLEKSGMCGNNSLLCHSSEISSVGYSCDCTAKLGTNANSSLNAKRPTSKSQQ